MKLPKISKTLHSPCGDNEDAINTIGYGVNIVDDGELHSPCGDNEDAILLSATQAVEQGILVAFPLRG